MPQFELLALMSGAGGIGAVVRYAVDTAVRQRQKSDYPWSTLWINVAGSFALGILAALVMLNAAPESVLLVLGTGFLGGFTTFSTASFETLKLLKQKRYLASLGHSVGMLSACLLAVALAWALAVVLAQTI